MALTVLVKSLSALSVPIKLALPMAPAWVDKIRPSGTALGTLPPHLLTARTPQAPERQNGYLEVPIRRVFPPKGLKRPDLSRPEDDEKPRYSLGFSIFGTGSS